MDISMELYKIFYITACEGNITRAARSLFISQPAVSQSIRALERALGCQLFLRNTRGVSLTGEGKMLMSYVEQSINLIFAAHERIKAIQRLEAGELKIGASDTLCKYYLLQYMQIFHNNHPNVRMNVTNRTSLETVALLKNGSVDIGFVNLPLSEEHCAGIDVTRCFKIRDCFVAGEKYFKLCDSPISLAQLTSLPLLMLEKNSSSRGYIDEFMSANGCVLTPEIELGSFDLLLEFAKAGLGIVCISEDAAQQDLDRGLIKEVTLELEIPPRHIGMLSLKKVPLNAAAKAFRNILMKNFIANEGSP